MKRGKELKKLVVLAGLLLVSVIGGLGQAAPTATRPIHLSAFGGVTGTYTGLFGGRNLGITAGADLGIRSFYKLRPFIEVRGTYPIKKGHVDSQKNFLGGLVVARPFGRLVPYVDLLVGRGSIDYGAGRVTPDRTLYYIKSASNVYSPGIGLDFELTDHFALKADAQIQRYSSPVAPSGHIYSKPITFGVVYRINVDRAPH